MPPHLLKKSPLWVMGAVPVIGLGVFFVMGASSPSTPAPPTSSERVLEIWIDEGKAGPEPLIRWTEADIRKLPGTNLPGGHVLKFQRRTEKAAVLGRGERVISVEGPLAGQLLEAAMLTLPVERKAEVDAVWVESADGHKAQIPRSFLTKYPVVFALSGVPSEFGDWMLVPPVTSQESKLTEEELPVMRFTLASVRKITLTNYRTHYGKFYLERRRDPAALRGEKLLVQNCFVCHAMGSGPTPDMLFSNGGFTRLRGLLADQARHPKVEGFPSFTAHDQQALKNYVGAREMEGRGQ